VTSADPPALSAYFAARGWKPFPFQREVWAAMRAGKSGLLHATTGAGKTLAVGFGAWLLSEKGAAVSAPSPRLRGEGRGEGPLPQPALKILWITPMRALAADTVRALEAALGEVGGYSVGLRTGDTDDKTRAAQRKRLPDLLVTTPESLTLMLAHPDTRARFAGLQAIIVDEWHELIGNKRGVQTQLALARLRRWRPDAPIWGLSATLGDLDAARRALLGPNRGGVRVQGKLDKSLVIDTALPVKAERIPWGGHLGIEMLGDVIAEIEKAATTLVFTNTRSQAEIWYKELISARPDWAGIVALHHASMERATRDWVENGLKAGTLKAVVCTSSLDLGVDFLPVERVLQIGSPKGVARLLQRAGRSGHAPGRPSRVTVVPSHSLELVESAAAQMAVAQGRIESQYSPDAPLDALAQHLVTIALGGGFRPEELLPEVRDTVAYERLSDEDWRWALDFVRHGGPTLAVYPDFKRVELDKDGVWRVPNARLAMMHRFNIGTITADAGLVVQYGPTPPGARLGVVEESFVARLRTGDKFWFAGKLLELARVRDQTAYVRPAKGGRATIPRWGGGRMPLSTTLADAMVELMGGAAQGRFEGPEMQTARPLLELQARWSALPTPETLVAETLKTRDGWHLFLYPFAGRNVHLGMASLMAWRAGQIAPGLFSLAVNDYGFEVLSANARAWEADLPKLLDASLSLDALRAQVLESLNAGELTRRRFRDIARISGLTPAAHPQARRTARQLQASAGLFFDVFRKYDPGHALIRQAEREVLEAELDVKLIAAQLERLSRRRLVTKTLKRCSPLAFPLMVEGFREKLSNEAFADRVERMAAALEKAAAK
jgi:ATP-dependent Lhr-like helicase